MARITVKLFPVYIEISVCARVHVKAAICPDRKSVLRCGFVSVHERFSSTLCAVIRSGMTVEHIHIYILTYMTQIVA